MSKHSPLRPWYHDARQNTLLEYANLKHECPDGVYISLKPGDHTEWQGVLFVRTGPYAPAVQRFLIRFPSDYPYLPPTVTFITDVFHPLIAPLTTYTYTTGSASSETVSATDEERLAPGGFSLRYGFPHWFKGTQKTGLSSTDLSRGAIEDGAISEKLDADMSKLALEDASVRPTPEYSLSSPPLPAPPQQSDAQAQEVLHRTGIVEVLRYIQRAFSNEAALDTLPLEAAGNQGAWKAWRAYRVSKGAVKSKSSSGQIQHDEWNWDGVWEDRVRKGVDTSISEPVLFGGTGGGDHLIHFMPQGDDILDRIRLRMTR